MNVTTNNTGDLSAVLTVKITPEDYSEKVDKVLKDYRQKASIPGFRPGKVPASLIKKQYGKAVLIDEVNHILQHAVYDHIKEENLDILGNPLPVAQDNIDWDNAREFEFEFELGLAPQFELPKLDKVSVPYLKISADKEMVDRYVDDYAKRYGKMSYPEKIGEYTLIKAFFTQLDEAGTPVEGGIATEGTFSIDVIEDKDAKAKLEGEIVGDIIELDVNKAFKEDFNLANVLSTEKETLEATSGHFTLEINEISKLEPAELNQELFDKVFGEGEVNSEDEFRAKIKEDAEKMFVNESERKFYEDVRTEVLSKVKVDLPVEFLKKWMQTAGEKPLTAEQAEEQFPEMEDSMKWQLVENKVIKENNIEVNQEELITYTKNLVRNQMMQYGQMPEEEQLDSIAQNVLQNQEEMQRINDQLFSAKLITFFKDAVKLKEKEVSFDEFLKTMQNK